MRAEEWVNAFAYGDPAPTEADLAVRTESGVRPDADGAQLVRVAVTAREVAAEERPVGQPVPTVVASDERMR